MNSKTYRLSADSENDKILWVEAFKEAISEGLSEYKVSFYEKVDDNVCHKQTHYFTKLKKDFFINFLPYTVNIKQFCIQIVTINLLIINVNEFM